MTTHTSHMHKDDDNSSENEKSDTEDERSITTENSFEEKNRSLDNIDQQRSIQGPGTVL